MGLKGLDWRESDGYGDEDLGLGDGTGIQDSLSNHQYTYKKR